MGGRRTIPDHLHRLFFKGISLLRGNGQAAVLGRYFDWWHRTPDPWRLESDDYEQHKYRATLEQVPDRPYERILDVGCSEGVFTRLVAERYPEAEVIGMDISARALERARARCGHLNPRVGFTRADLLTHSRMPRFDLVFCAETLYYLGRDDRLRLASTRLGGLLAPSGVLIAVHPWPESRRLHAHLDTGAAITKIAEHVDEECQRPFAVSVYQEVTPRGAVPPP